MTMTMQMNDYGLQPFIEHFEKLIGTVRQRLPEVDCQAAAIMLDHLRQMSLVLHASPQRVEVDCGSLQIRSPETARQHISTLQVVLDGQPLRGVTDFVLAGGAEGVTLRLGVIPSFLSHQPSVQPAPGRAGEQGVEEPFLVEGRCES
jgi:hypothetical protein